MADKTWKKFERQIAGFFGTDRTPLSGGNSRHTRSDMLHKWLYVEMKYGKSIPKFFTDIWAEAKENAKAEGKIPMVVLKPKNYKGALVLCDLESIEAILREKELCQ